MSPLRLPRSPGLPGRRRVQPATVLSAVFVVAGLGLMLASLQIESGRHRAVDVSELAASVVAPTATAPSDWGTPAASERAATRAFLRATDAERDLAYEGTRTVTRWHEGVSSTVVVSVRNVPGGAVMVRGDDAGTVGRSFVRGADGSASATTLEHLVTNYCLTVVGPDRVAGRSATELQAERADRTVAARFWVDDSSGLMLRRELYDRAGELAESAELGRLRIDASAPEPEAADESPVQAWQVLDASAVQTLRTGGWPVPEQVAGGLRLYDVREHTEPGPSDAPVRVVQLGYTDGLVAVSVFLQEGRLDRAALDGYQRVDVDGASVWTRSSGAPFYVWQTRAEPGPELVASVTTDSAAVPFGSVVAAWPTVELGGGGVGERVSRGIRVVTEWFDPKG